MSNCRVIQGTSAASVTLSRLTAMSDGTNRTCHPVPARAAERSVSSQKAAAHLARSPADSSRLLRTASVPPQGMPKHTICTRAPAFHPARAQEPSSRSGGAYQRLPVATPQPSAASAVPRVLSHVGAGTTSASSKATIAVSRSASRSPCSRLAHLRLDVAGRCSSGSTITRHRGLAVASAASTSAQAGSSRESTTTRSS